MENSFKTEWWQCNDRVMTTWLHSVSVYKKRAGVYKKHYEFRIFFGKFKKKQYIELEVHWWKFPNISYKSILSVPPDDRLMTTWWLLDDVLLKKFLK